MLSLPDLEVHTTRVINKLLSSKDSLENSRHLSSRSGLALSPAVQKLRLVHSEFTANLNYNLNPLAKENAGILPMRELKIVHYHGSLYWESFGWAMSYFNQLPADRVELIRKYVPLSANATFLTRLQKRVLRHIRQVRVNRFKQQAVRY